MGFYEDDVREREERERVREARRREIHRNGSQTIGEFSKNFSIGSSSGGRCRKCGSHIDYGTLCGACSWN